LFLESTYWFLVQQRLTQANHTAINNVRLYIQVTHLSEITDTNGTTVLPHALQDGPSSTRSTLQWPQQPQHKPAAWKHWRQVMQDMYLRTDSNRLIHPLKEWESSTFNLDWQWDWRIQPITLKLYQWNGDAWTIQQPLLIKPTYVAYQLWQQQPTDHNLDLLPLPHPLLTHHKIFSSYCPTQKRRITNARSP